MEHSFVGAQSSHGIMDEDHLREEEYEDIGSLSSSSEDEEEVGGCDDDATSSGSSSNGSLFEMSSLISQLPFKRGLSKHFEGKSQSFTSLSNVKSLEDLIKPERPFKRRQLKSSKSYGWGLDKSLSTKSSSRTIAKKSTKGGSSFSSSLKRHGSFLGSKPPFPSQRSGSISGQTLLESIG